METAPGPTTTISRDALMALPLYTHTGPIHLIRDPDQVPAALEALWQESLLGFDIETKPSFTRGVVHPPALVQLAGARDCYVFQLNHLNRLEGLKDLFSAPHPRKVGTAIRDDLKKLREFDPFEPAGFIEIADLCRDTGIGQTGLRPLAGLLMGIRVSKREQRSNWGRDTLTPSQVAYAATDAWISREVYLRLLERPRVLPQQPALPAVDHPA